MKVGVDLISGESPIEELIEGCVDALVEDKEVEVVLIGKGDVYRNLLEQKKYRSKQSFLKRVSILEASEIVTMEDDPLTVMKQKKDSSIIKALQAHKNGEIDAFFSPGNTGALVLAATLILGRIKGVKKPALTAFLPNKAKGVNVFLDVGASPECEIEDFAKFAVMGRIYAQEIFGVKNPKTALLNIGEEPHKGTAFMKSIHKRLSEADLNFIGNVEGRGLFDPGYDVIVTDGYIGNIALKTIEGTAKIIKSILEQAVKSNIAAILSYPLYKSVFTKLRQKMDPEEYGGAPLLGVNGNVYKGHGNSGRRAVKYGILAAAHAVRNNVLGKINHQIKKLVELEA
jgi:glycerol-3-phosphate acyltransferase PlsX